MSKHTPGPWRCTKTQDNVIVNEGGDKWIARALIGTTRSPRFIADAEVAAANARLIAAAPDMLEGLKGIRANLIRLAWEENSLMIEGIDALIAKAEGRS